METISNNQLQYLISVSPAPQMHTTPQNPKSKNDKQLYILLGIIALESVVCFVAYRNAMKSVLKRIKRENEYC